MTDSRNQTHHRNVAKAMNRVKANVKLRDSLLFGLARIWTVVLSMVAQIAKNTADKKVKQKNRVK